MPTLAPPEIKALARIVDDLDYYEVLDAPRGASGASLRSAYHAAFRRFHPDAHRHLEPELRFAVERIAKRVTEAYSVLRDPRRRRLYDERVLNGALGSRRMQLVESEVEAERRSTEEREGRTPNGRRYFALARADLARGDLGSAARNLQTCLAYEPDNALFQRHLAEVKTKLR